ncbi:MAG: hypothetical protein M1823_005453 [Watsoniomyces obsoletus]|nr:MAG: hypothetical protein M1823_005453 [Watsoniomyces obsoletus]
MALQFAPFVSDLELPFYSALASHKINHDKLDDSARRILGLYEIRPTDAPESSCRMQVLGNALTSDDVLKGHCRAEGIIKNFNTIEEYRKIEKNTVLQRAGRTIWDAILDGSIYSCPSLLASFSVISFADLKRYKFTYWFAFPALHSDPPWRLDKSFGEARPVRLTALETTTLVDKVQTWRYSVDARQHGFFLVKRRWSIGQTSDPDASGEDSPTPDFLWEVAALSRYETGFFTGVMPEDRFVAFVDPSTYPQNPGWMLRNLLVLVRQRWKLDQVQILCYRDIHTRRDEARSLIMQVHIEKPEGAKDEAGSGQATSDQAASNQAASNQTTNDQVTSDQTTSDPEVSDQGASEPAANNQTTSDPAASAAPKEDRPRTPQMPKVTGWERNRDGKLASKVANLAEYLDPRRLADQSVDLNLKLMRWRIAPNLNLEVIKNTKCLLLGSGTLGSYVARNLLGWGVRKITFVDNARVSFSNPVRQPLFDFKDCLDGGVEKAFRAAEALQEIYPGVESMGYCISVPMAGHPITTTDETRVRSDYETLKRLISDHDVIFLLMDTRESRWLPTVMGKAAGKLVMNAALGFDTFVVMRHGVPLPQHPDQELGCYFCNDVVAPADSIKDQTLDQQCTVTRPGIAAIASALLVELLVSILQHPLKSGAPAPTSQDDDNRGEGEHNHPLGLIPHQIRGYLSNFRNILIRGKNYDCCSACSDRILNAYKEGDWEFVKRALNEDGYVAEVSGLAEVQKAAELAAAEIEWDEGEDELLGEDDQGGDGEII